MGQRSQIILLRKDEEGIKVQTAYHNQWRYGIGFLSTLEEILKAWDQGIGKLEKEERLYDWQLGNLAEKVIEYVNVKDFPDVCGYSEIQNERYPKDKTIQELIKHFDNNNGFIILLLDGKKLSYDIITGDEDADENRRIDAEGYLRLFYKTDKEIVATGLDLEEVNEMIENIKTKERFNSEEIILGKQEVKEVEK